MQTGRKLSTRPNTVIRSVRAMLTPRLIANALALLEMVRRYLERETNPDLDNDADALIAAIECDV